MRTKNTNGKARQAVLRAFRADPSAALQELVRATGYSQTTVYYHLKNLKDEGVISRENLPRGCHNHKVIAANGKLRSQKECQRQKRAREIRNERAANFEKRIEKIVQAAKEKGTYYGL